MVNKRRRWAVKPSIKGMIASVVLSEVDTMFGMQDPSQTLHQIERYMQEGRLELSEVMATQFCDMMLAKKKRDPQQQIFLLKGLRLMCDVYLMRDKADQSMASIKRMHSERKALVKILQKHAPQMLEAMQPEHEDHLRAGRLYAAAGKQRAASKAFAKCEKLSPGHLAAAHTATDLMPTKAHVDRLLAAVSAAGDVIHANGTFELNRPPPRRWPSKRCSARSGMLRRISPARPRLARPKSHVWKVNTLRSSQGSKPLTLACSRP